MNNLLPTIGQRFSSLTYLLDMIPLHVLLILEDGLHDERVTDTNDEDRQEEPEEEDVHEVGPVGPCPGQVVERAAGEESFRHERPPAQQRRAHDGQAVRPDEHDGRLGLGVGEEDAAVPRFHGDDEAALDGDGRQSDDGHQPEQAAQGGVDLAPWKRREC